MFCPKCGTQLSENSAFCHFCGAQLNQQQQQQYQQPQYQQPQYQQPQQFIYVSKPPVPGRGLGIAGMVLGIIGLVYAVYCFFMAIAIADTNLRNIEPFAIVFIFFAVLSILGISLAGAGRNKGYINGISTSGIVTSAIGLFLYFVSILIVLVA